ncbi:MAG: CheR family methyltransferase [Oligoflexus sp.]
MNTAKEINQLDYDTFCFLRDSLHQIAGISLSESKTDLLVGRLRKRIISLNMKSLSEYGNYLKAVPATHHEWQQFLNCLTTNKTDFFRESEHFRYLIQTFLPSWQEKSRPIKIWSIPCSTGEEAYTLAMVLDEAQKYKDFDFQISASDIDTSVLDVAKKGVYKKSRLSEVPEIYHRSAFRFGTDDIKDWVAVKPHLKTKITFKRCNLIAPPYPWEHKFDVIFCRNVLIYFSTEVIQQVLSHIYHIANPGAFLFVGHSESMQQQTHQWVRIHPSIYQKKD